MLLAAVLLHTPALRADTTRYELAPGSRILPLCVECDTPPAGEDLQGTFDLSLLPVPTDYAVEALTAVDWTSRTFTIRGTGFIQRIGTERLAMVIEAKLNDETVLLTSGRRQRSSPGRIEILLSTPRGKEPAYAVHVIAVPIATDAPDDDSDDVPNATDNCPDQANGDQLDTDGDNVGDGCDSCPETAANRAANAAGCALEQVCPCSGPTDGGEWSSQRAYVRCVSRAAKQMLREGSFTRSEVLRQVRAAVRTGCGRSIVAMN